MAHLLDLDLKPGTRVVLPADPIPPSISIYVQILLDSKILIMLIWLSPGLMLAA